MLEREALTEAVHHLLHESRLGRGGALFIIGESGLGKTTVLEFARILASSDARVGLARGDVMEAGLPFGLVAQAVHELGGGNALEGASARASPDEARTSRFYRTLRWLEGVTADGPVVLAFDDLHWSDGDSLALLSYLCRRIDALPVAVIATLRPWPPEAEEMCLRLAAAGYGRIERLAPLSEPAARALLVERAGHPVSDEVIEQALVSSARNPLLLEQVALAIQGEGADEEAVRRWHAPDDRLFLHRFAGLSQRDLRLSQAASVLGRRFRPELAVALAGLQGDDAAPTLDALSRSGLVCHAGASTAEFTHLLFQQALYEDLPPLVREELHGRAFRLLLDRGMEAEAAEHAVRGNLVGEPDAVGVLVRAGGVALRAGAMATAVERLQAAERLGGPRVNTDVLLLLGEARLATGHGVAAAQVYERLLGRPDLSTTTRAEALRMLGRALFMTGAGTRGVRRFDEAAELAGPDHPGLAVHALLDHSRAAWLTEGPVGALPAIARARTISCVLDEAMQMEVEAAWGFVAFAAGDATGLEAAIAAGDWAATDHARALRDLSWDWGTLRNSGRAAKYAERFANAEAVFALTFARAEREGSPYGIVSVASHHADTLARQGRLDEALDLATRAVALADLAPMAEAFAYAVKALLLLHLDRATESERCCQRAERAATIRGQWLPLLRVWHIRALRDLHEGRLDQACNGYERLADKTAQLGIGEPCLVASARHAVIAQVRNGRVGEAERTVAWVEGCAERLPCRWPRIAAATGRASLAEARGKADTAEAGFRAALALHGDVDLPPERVETLLQFGSFLRRSGRLVEARDALREALALAERIGATWLARVVHAELAVAGGRRRRRDASPEGLTAQEQRVAELAASGSTAADIARQLSLSVRTIETHLGRIYAKLGIHSQRELMAAAHRRHPSGP
ncbi:MAG: ATP-binding protein [Acidimicrobiales bacterium]